MEKVLAALRKGGLIAVYDGDEREGEADLMFHPGFAAPRMVETLRRDAGGLICLAIGKEKAAKMGLAFMTDVMRKAGLGAVVVKRTAYGDEPAFSIAVNHRKTYTGIPDNDRALTMKEIAKVMESTDERREFEDNFYAPGHVFLLIGRGLEVRKGHTELGLELAKRAGLSETIVMCEMLGSGKALAKKEVMEYAKKNDIPFIEGRDIYGKKD